jgi:hypothetical protein
MFADERTACDSLETENRGVGWPKQRLWVNREVVRSAWMRCGRGEGLQERLGERREVDRHRGV